MLGKLLCRLNLQHAYHLESTDDGQRYRQCTRCGKDEYRGAGGPGDWMAPIGF